MKKIKILFYAFILSLMSLEVNAEVNLNVKIGQIVGLKKIESVKNISANYDQDIVIVQPGLKNKIIINLKKVKNISMNGARINPVQIDMKMIDSSKKIIGKVQTVTSFYKNEAQFSVKNSLVPESGDMDIFLNFEEI